MRKSFCILLVLITGFGLDSVNPVFSAGKKKASSKPDLSLPVISSVAANSITVTEMKTTKTFMISQFTEILVNGQKAKIGDLKPGMTVNVVLGADPSKASRVEATGK